MNFALLLSTVAGASAVPFSEMVEQINSANHGWTSEIPTRFESLSDVKILCGTFQKDHPNYVNITGMQHAAEDLNPAKDIPTAFDARTQWPKCSTISTVRDQSSCGSCWAFASTEVFSDSRCISTGEDKLFSTEDTAGCCKGIFCGMSNGCNGGQPSAALHWMTHKGVVSGGDYADLTKKEGGCKPYSLAPCAHHVNTTKYPACPAKEYSLSCEKTCSDTASGLDYSKDKHKAGSSQSYTTVEGMQTALMTTGPLAVAFTVYEDFPTYKTGVYKHVSGQALGGHAVEMVGWGVENGTDYWLIKNSWNSMWGDNGFFKIVRGTNECGIEDDVTGVTFV